MSTNRKPQISIPKPCHEDWDKMTPEAKGRHCAVCSKVVRDFTSDSMESITQALASAPAGSVCGRVPVEALAPPPLPANTYFLFPVERLRTFFLAFLAAFGWQVWGSLAVQAQAPIPDKIEFTETAAPKTQVQELHGRIVDTYSNDSIPLVRVTAMRGMEAGPSVLTDENGRFVLKLTKAFLAEGAYEIHISYLGHERTEFDIAPDIQRMAITVDLASLMPEVQIRADRSQLQGNMVTGISILGGIQPLTIGHTFSVDQKTLYRPLDEWLFMNFSEINHSGRH